MGRRPFRHRWPGIGHRNADESDSRGLGIVSACRDDRASAAQNVAGGNSDLDLQLLTSVPGDCCQRVVTGTPRSVTAIGGCALSTRLSHFTARMHCSPECSFAPTGRRVRGAGRCRVPCWTAPSGPVLSSPNGVPGIRRKLQGRRAAIPDARPHHPRRPRKRAEPDGLDDAAALSTSLSSPLSAIPIRRNLTCSNTSRARAANRTHPCTAGISSGRTPEKNSPDSSPISSAPPTPG